MTTHMYSDDQQLCEKCAEHGFQVVADAEVNGVPLCADCAAEDWECDGD